MRPVDLATQSAHMNIDKVGFRNELVAPDVLQEGCARQQLSVRCIMYLSN